MDIPLIPNLNWKHISLCTPNTFLLPWAWRVKQPGEVNLEKRNRQLNLLICYQKHYQNMLKKQKQDAKHQVDMKNKNEKGLVSIK